MKHFFLSLTIFLKMTLATAQGSIIDSLKNLLTEDRNDTTRVLLLTQIGEDYLYKDPDTALAFALKAYDLSQELKYFKGEIYSSACLAECWWSLGEFATGIKLLLPKIKEIESLKDTLILLNTYRILGQCYRDQGDFDKALEYIFRIQYHNQSLKGCPFCRIGLASIGEIYLGKNRPDSAQYYVNAAFGYPPDPGLKGLPLLVYGKTYAAYKKYDSAFYYYRQSITEFAQVENQKDLAGAYNNIATLFESRGYPDSSISYLQKSLNITRPKKFLRETMEALVLLSKAYENLNTDSAFHYYKEAMTAKDSLYSHEKQRRILTYEFNERLQQQENENAQTQFRYRTRTYVLLAATCAFLILGLILWHNNRQKQNAKIKIENAYTELKSTQAQLIQSEKMASLGELTAGIAHEIQNPLNFVNNFSEVNNELIEEMVDEIKKGNQKEAEAIANNIRQNLEKINNHGRRADSIVKGMLQHSRMSSGQKELTDINALCDEYLRLSYHGLRAKDKSFNAGFETNFDPSAGKIKVVPQDIGRVLLNLYNNAFYAVTEKVKTAGNNYEPRIIVSTKKINDKIEILVKDNGNGIPHKVFDKIFQPFFTTKPAGQGTGLGLSLAYDIIKAHGGEIKVETKEGEGTVFVVQLPV